MAKRISSRERLFAKIAMPTDPDACWLWMGSRNAWGYGKFWWKQSVRGAHRAAYEILVGDVPDGLVLDHLCRNRACVNPTHLEPVTERVNILRGISPSARAAARNACAVGHPYTTATYVDKKGARHCGICRAQREKTAAYQAKHAARERRRRGLLGIRP